MKRLYSITTDTYQAMDMCPLFVETYVAHAHKDPEVVSVLSTWGCGDRHTWVITPHTLTFSTPCQPSIPSHYTFSNTYDNNYTNQPHQVMRSECLVKWIMLAFCPSWFLLYNILVTYHFTLQEHNCYLGFSRRFSAQSMSFCTIIH